MKRITFALLVLALGGYAFTLKSFAAETEPKCKHSAHLHVEIAAQGSKALAPKNVFAESIEPGSCRNEPTYAGTVYVIVTRGKLGMRLYPEAAVYVRDQFAALAGHSVTIEHTVDGQFVAYRAFDDAARAKLVVQLSEAGA